MRGRLREDSDKIVQALRVGEKLPNVPPATLFEYRKRHGIVAADKKHPNYEKIMDAIKAGEKWIWIQTVYNCTPSTICKYRKIIKAQAVQS